MEFTNDSFNVPLPVKHSFYKRKDVKEVPPEVLGQFVIDAAINKGYADLSRLVRPWPDLIKPILLVGEKGLPAFKKMLTNSLNHNPDQFKKAFKVDTVDEAIHLISDSLKSGKYVWVSPFGYNVFLSPTEVGTKVKQNTFM